MGPPEQVYPAGGRLDRQAADCRTIRFECGLDSDLPNKLRQAGHPVRDFGTHERLMPVVERVVVAGTSYRTTRQHVAVGIAGVWQFDLPSLDPPARDNGGLEIV